MKRKAPFFFRRRAVVGLCGSDVFRNLNVGGLNETVFDRHEMILYVGEEVWKLFKSIKKVLAVSDEVSSGKAIQRAKFRKEGVKPANEGDRQTSHLVDNTFSDAVTSCYLQ
jgi:hypothetical protein